MKQVHFRIIGHCLGVNTYHAQTSKDKKLTKYIVLIISSLALAIVCGALAFYMAAIFLLGIVIGACTCALFIT